MSFLDKLINSCKTTQTQRSMRGESINNIAPELLLPNATVTYLDVSKYDGKPFDLDSTILAKMNMSFLQINQHNLKVLIQSLDSIKMMILENPCIDKILFNTSEISISYECPENEYSLPESYINLVPYTPTNRECKYPIEAHFISPRIDKYETTQNYLGILWYLGDGNIGKADLTIRKNQHENFIIQLRCVNNKLKVTRINSYNHQKNKMVTLFP